MNTHYTATRILCYGDSNTWGRSGKNTDRYAVNVRWTGILQEKLGSDFEIIEEGLRSRTTNLNDDPLFPGRNGLEYLRPCLESHNPIDLVILWLGTNDLKTKFNRTAQEVGAALAELVQETQQVAHKANGKQTTLLLISPPIVREEVLKPNSQFAGAGSKSKQLANYIQQSAERSSSYFLNIAQFVEPGGFDGVHLEPESHVIAAEEIFRKVKEICQ